MLSQGRVDGTGGRGFYSGLEETLLHIVDSLHNATVVSDMLLQAEEIFCKSDQNSNQDTNLLVAGVWKPVTNVLSERFPGMFTVGVAAAMHRAFTSLEKFTFELLRVLLGQPNSTPVIGTKNDAVKLAYHRVCRHPDVVAFRNKWKLDLYFQVIMLK